MSESTLIELTNIQCIINGRPYRFSVTPQQSLMEILRHQGITSVKQGCAVGECGACTVLIDDVPTDSCLYLALWADGKTLRTAEGEVKDGKLSRVQQAYVDSGAVQCGFCTPGLVMTSTALVEKFARRPLSEQEIRRGLAGNLCRCTGYQMVVRAVQSCMEDEPADK